MSFEIKKISKALEAEITSVAKKLISENSEDLMEKTLSNKMIIQVTRKEDLFTLKKIIHSLTIEDFFVKIGSKTSV